MSLCSEYKKDGVLKKEGVILSLGEESKYPERSDGALYVICSLASLVILRFFAKAQNDKLSFILATKVVKRTNQNLILTYFHKSIALLIISLFICQQGVLAQEPTRANLEAVLSYDIPDTSKIRLIDSLTDKINYHSSELPFIYKKKAIELGRIAKTTSLVANLELELGKNYCNIDATDSSFHYLNRAVANYRSIGDSTGVGNSFGILRYVHSLNNDFQTALEYAYHALEIFEDLEDERGIGASYVDISGVLLDLEKHDEALDFALKAIEILEPLKDTFELAYALEKAAYIYSIEEDSVQALSMINQTLKLYEDDDEWYHNFLILRIDILKAFGESEKALSDLFAIREYNLVKGNDSQLRETEQLIGSVYIDLGRPKEALTLFLDIFNEISADSSSEIYLKEEINYSLYQVYNSLGEYELALKHFQEYKNIRDRAFTVEADKTMSEMRTRYETEKKEGEIKQLKSEKAQQQAIIILGIGLLLLASIFSIVFYRNNLERKKTNQILHTQKEEIEKKSAQNELLLKEIHHRVKNNLQTISSLLYLQSAHIKDANVRAAVEEGKHRVEAMALIHQKLYQRDNLAAIEMKDYLQNLGQTLLQTFLDKPDRVVLKVDMPELELDVDTAIPIGLIVNELVTNSIKYAFGEELPGTLSISLLRQSEEELLLTVADNGPGFDEETLPKGTAFGSQLTKQLTLQLDGKMALDTNEGYKTEILFKNFKVIG